MVRQVADHRRRREGMQARLPRVGIGRRLHRVAILKVHRPEPGQLIGLRRGWRACRGQRLAGPFWITTPGPHPPLHAVPHASFLRQRAHPCAPLILLGQGGQRGAHDGVRHSRRGGAQSP